MIINIKSWGGRRRLEIASAQGHGSRGGSITEAWCYCFKGREASGGGKWLLILDQWEERQPLLFPSGEKHRNSEYERKLFGSDKQEAQTSSTGNPTLFKMQKKHD